MQITELRCRCGEVEGQLTNAAPERVNRVVCYCDDCQAFLHHLGRADLMDAQGGTDIVQVAPAALSFTKGKDRIVGMRLSPKGLNRWYADCCKTPVGNTLGVKLPFVGIEASAFRTENHDELFGKPIGAILGKYAIGEPPKGSTKLNLPLFWRAIRMILGWRLGGKTWPHPFFDRETKEPRFPLSVIPLPERERLRTLCGPRPA